MTDIPPELLELSRRRDEKRAAKDFAGADALRDRILELGFEITDTPEGGELRQVQASVARAVGPGEVESVLEARPVYRFSVQWLVQAWPEDVVRGIEAIERFRQLQTVQHVIVDCTGSAVEWPGDADIVRLDRDYGWAVGRNAGLKRSAGEIVIVADGSVEAMGDLLSPLAEALANPSCGITGPFGIVTEDLHDFRASDGPAVDAIEGYLMAFRREMIEEAGLFDEKFKFYRTADIEYSFRVKDRGYSAIAVELPIRRHEHRMWASTPEAERDRLSKRNFYRFLDRWRGRTDLTVAGG